ncbi:MAG: endonuclease, partial [Mediterranea sp.]|nr:endonuclease [Mediterranea sp.]
KIGEDTATLINCHLESNKLTKEDKVVYEGIWKSPQTDNVKKGTRLLIPKLAEASAIRAVQAQIVAGEINSSRHPYVMVCGDFNDTSISYTHRVISQNMYDAFTESGCGMGISYNMNRFYFRIDHILTGKNMKVYNCMVDRSIKDSDHYPVKCYIAKQ